MKVISFNINGIRARIHQLKAIIEKHDPDIIGLQETKVHDEQFPLEAINELGYKVIFHGGKAHYGVAIMSKTEPQNTQKGFPNDSNDAQRRAIAADFIQPNNQKITVINCYFPQGESIDHPTKYPYKRKFYKDLMVFLNTKYKKTDNIILMGDLNVSRTDLDIGIGEVNKKRWLKSGKCSFQPEERSWLENVFQWGFVDTFRHIHPNKTDTYSWFDYRSKGFNDNRGLRIDAILTTKNLTEKVKESNIDYELRGIDKPSDHAPVWCEIVD